jgi:amino acid transporter
VKTKFAAGDWVAIILAAGVAVSMIILIAGVVWGAIKHGSTAATLTENETQVLIAAFGGIFGILGAYLGFRAGNGHGSPRPKASRRDELDDTAELPPR